MSTISAAVFSHTRALMLAIGLTSAGLAALVVGQGPVEARQAGETVNDAARADRPIQLAPVPVLDPIRDQAPCAIKRVRIVYSGYGEHAEQACGTAVRS